MAYNCRVCITMRFFKLMCIPLFCISSHTYSADDNKDIRFSMLINTSCSITAPQSIEIPTIPYIELMNTAAGTKLDQYQAEFELEATCGGEQIKIVLTNLDGNIENDCLLPMPSIRLCMIRNTNTALNFNESTPGGMSSSFNRSMYIQSHRKTPIKIIPYKGSGSIGFGKYSSLLQITISPN